MPLHNFTGNRYFYNKRIFIASLLILLLLLAQFMYSVAEYGKVTELYQFEVPYQTLNNLTDNFSDVRLYLYDDEIDLNIYPLYFLISAEQGNQDLCQIYQ